MVITGRDIVRCRAFWTDSLPEESNQLVSRLVQRHIPDVCAGTRILTAWAGQLDCCCCLRLVEPLWYQSHLGNRIQPQSGGILLWRCESHPRPTETPWLSPRHSPRTQIEEELDAQEGVRRAHLAPGRIARGRRRCAGTFAQDRPRTPRTPAILTRLRACAVGS